MLGEDSLAGVDTRVVVGSRVAADSPVGVDILLEDSLVGVDTRVAAGSPVAEDSLAGWDNRVEEDILAGEDILRGDNPEAVAGILAVGVGIPVAVGDNPAVVVDNSRAVAAHRQRSCHSGRRTWLPG